MLVRTTVKFKYVLNSFDITNCVEQPTHEKCHQLDTIAVRRPSVTVQPPLLSDSDHSLIAASINVAGNSGTATRLA